ncbi:tRNA-(ms[2]io[6]A)-hydroxylase [Motiliproteus sp. SC1-56]|uniref:tRNA-(ms[2]io[6]A)-hydroxylase n=1 Tax=Motiliproteus sp. SC1-56 TaxID=2799565 RepID=UPI001A90A1E5|nr:tRNA-(ms[2]io[6]A)-hydroxylase [Motiliproteus sp. SC1-56]
MEILAEIRLFLACPTPASWVEAALDNLPLLLIDHAHCEKKAASSAMNLIFRYADKPDLLHRLSRIVREEMIHFEQVLALMAERGITYDHLSPSRYAQGLRQHVRTHEPARLVDTLIVGAFIEARSCERFAVLAPRLEDEALARYYHSLLKAEGRHYRDYLELAEQAAQGPIDDRVAFFAEQERQLIEEVDDCFRFHSGVPVSKR